MELYIDEMIIELQKLRDAKNFWKNYITRSGRIVMGRFGKGRGMK